jgi:hypothetical protein
VKLLPVVGDVGEALYASNGRMLWSIGLLAQISCQMFFKHFPFDTQKCTYHVAAISGNSSFIRMISAHHIMGLPQMSLNYDVSYEDSKEYPPLLNKSITGFDIILKRKIYPYLMNVFLPTYALTMVSFGSFLIPASVICCGARGRSHEQEERIVKQCQFV